MQAYPSGLEGKFWDSNIAEINNNIKGNSQNNVGVNRNNRFYRFPYLSYSAHGKRSFHISLTRWLLKIQNLKSLTTTNLFDKWCPSSNFNEKRFIHVDNDVENYISSQSSFKQYTTLLAWERVIRDRTALYCVTQLTGCYEKLIDPLPLFPHTLPLIVILLMISYVRQVYLQKQSLDRLLNVQLEWKNVCVR